MEVIKPQEVEQRPENPQNPESLNPSESPMFAQIQSFFGVQQADRGQRDMLNYIYEALRSDDNTEAGMLWKIKSIESRLGQPPIGVDRITHLHNYLKLQSQLYKTANQIEQAYGG